MATAAPHALRAKHVFAVLIPVPALLPQRSAVELWRLHLFLAKGIVQVANHALNLAHHTHSMRQDKRTTRRRVMCKKKRLGQAQNAVV